MITNVDLIIANVIVGGWCTFVLSCAFIAALLNDRRRPK